MMLRSLCRRLRYAIGSWFPHKLKIRTLTRDWVETDELILHANFQMLVDYVECQCAWMNVVFSEEKWNELPFWQKIGLHLGMRFHSRDHGVKYLQWESSLSDDDGNLTLQAHEAKKIYDLYWWWTIARGYRKDPSSLVVTERPDYFPWEESKEPLTEEEQAKKRQWLSELDAVMKLEEEYYQEDTEKLKELIDARHSLWT